MAQESTNGGTAVEEERRPTERVILEKVRALVIPDEATDDQIRHAVEALRGKRRGTLPTPEAWIEVSRQIGSSKVAAVEAYAGKAGTPDAKIGTFRAPSSTAWKGAVVHEAPPAPLVQRSLID